MLRLPLLTPSVARAAGCKGLFWRPFSSASSKVRVMISQVNDPFFNIATEEWLFRTGDPAVQTLYLWRNEPTIIIGRNQNPWKECNVQKMNAEGVHLTRRFSGGGTVYQDLGNTNFTFLASDAFNVKEKNSQIIIEALAQFGLKAETSGRNDIVVEGAKISGAAYKMAPPRALHHGTLLINVDMSALGTLLNPNKLKLKSKGISSVASRVVNLQKLNKEITHDSLSKAVIEAFCAHHGSAVVEPELLDPTQLNQIESLKKVYDELRDDAWRFGETPEFSHHLEQRFESPQPWGTIDVHIDSKKGQILDVKVFSDALYPDLIDSLAEALTGVKYDSAGIDRAMSILKGMPGAVELKMPDMDMYIDTIGNWLKESL